MEEVREPDLPVDFLSSMICDRFEFDIISQMIP